MNQASKSTDDPERTPPGPAPALAPVLELTGVVKRFADREILRGIDLTVRPGERLVLLGESGSGKSTLLNLIAGLESCDQGSIAVDGMRIEGLNDDQRAAFRRRTIGFVFQAFLLVPHLSALRNVMVPLLLNGVAAAVARERALEALAQLGLAHRAQAMPAELSGGEQQRVATARALVHRPRLVLADEPTGNLDPETATQALDGIDQALRQSGATLVMVTHSRRAARVGTRWIELRDHRLEPVQRPVVEDE